MLSVILAVSLALQSASAAASTPSPAELPPPPEQVLAIPDGLRDLFHAQVLDKVRSPEQRLYKLPEFLFSKDGLNLKYDAYATHTVTESYQTRKINCLAFTILAVALAREAGLNIYPQQINRVMAWNLDGNVVIQSMHANAIVDLHDRKFMLDILASRPSRPMTDYRITDEHLLAIFYGNRAAELLIHGRLQEALIWQQVALRHDQQDATLWNNAGLLQERMGDHKTAEAYFLKSAQMDPKLTTPLSNLIALYRSTGDLRQMHLWQQRATNVLRHDPYYQYAQGQRSEQAGDIPTAMAFYRQAVDLYNQEHLFHFALARVYYKLGQFSHAKRELVLAEKLSDGVNARLYQAKLEALRRMSRATSSISEQAVILRPAPSASSRLASVFHQ